MSKPFIVQGDKTDHGGAVSAGSPFTDIDGKPVARQNDPVSCPKCGPTVIAAGDPTCIIDGMPIARHGDKTACGATLISGQVRVFVDSGGGGGAAVAAAPQQGDQSSAGNKTNGATTPAPAAESTTGLGQKVDSLVSKSPSLQADIERLKADGWQIVYGAPGQGSYVERRTPQRIVIDGAKQGDAEAVARSLSHEVGHATYGYAPDYSSKTAYVNGALADEGAGTISSIRAQREILANGGPDIGLSGSRANYDSYNAAYDQFLKDGDAGKARYAIGKVYGANERASVKMNGELVKYSDYYGDWYDKNYGP